MLRAFFHQSGARRSPLIESLHFPSFGLAQLLWKRVDDICAYSFLLLLHSKAIIGEKKCARDASKQFVCERCKWYLTHSQHRNRGPTHLRFTQLHTNPILAPPSVAHLQYKSTLTIYTHVNTNTIKHTLRNNTHTQPVTHTHTIQMEDRTYGTNVRDKLAYSYMMDIQGYVYKTSVYLFWG